MYNFKRIDNTNKIQIDCSSNHIFILSGGLTTMGIPSPWVLERLNVGLHLNRIEEKHFYCIGGGTNHKPPILNNSNYVIHESLASVNYLINNNINKSNIKYEISSYDTIGNAYFSYINFIIPLELRNICVITSEFHIPRTKVIFDYLNKIFKLDINIIYIESVNNMDSELLNIRTKRELNSKNSFIENVCNKINTKSDFIEWLYAEHSCYNSCILNEISDISSSIVDSY